ncbi:uncharacterized protein LOC112556217 isoform X1 [Pomacea canaliculata]|uniref:uncharacterized protein LOC112556217 isoform X1 n=1 Tax=Pomacea canaliculata TaxID=400727 RepID=UPI000D728930|nr:uncharacterized protein LOC112556217 isoform X1 [Pomacea canaliculata]XP_025080799.1 uncharacterized protein LOC112556217 isoform X1 [Pomacea canaliculata]
MECKTCKKDLLIPFARQQTYLRNILQKFKEMVDPLTDDIVDILITKGVLKIGANQEFTESACPVQQERARRLWQLLLYVPPSKFFNIVVPLLERFRSTFKTIGASMSEIHEMCFRCVVVAVIPLEDIADELCENNFLKLPAYKDLHDKNVLLTDRWQKFFRMISTTEQIEVLEVFRRHLEKHEIPEPEDLKQHLKQSTLCLCQEKPQRSKWSCSDCTEEPMEVNAASGGVDEDMSEYFADCLPALRGVHSDRVDGATWVTDHIYENWPLTPLSLDIEIPSDSDDDFPTYLSLENDSDSSEDFD